MNQQNPSPGLLLVLSAPSGAGKTTLAHRVLKEEQNTHFSVSHTTREPRGRERDGIDYHFVDSLTFQQRIERGEFVEWAEVHGHFYGSPQAAVDRAITGGQLVVFDIDVQGGQTIKRKYAEAILVFILPPSVEELERRLRSRGTDGEETIRRRMLGARVEMERGVASYDYILINDSIEGAYQQLKAVVTAERCRRGRVDLHGLGLWEGASQRST